MKLMLLPVVVLALLPGPSVRFESDGVRLGEEVVTEKAISLKSVGQVPVLVSGSVVENLSAANKVLEIALADKTVLLEVGVRLDRQGESYRLSTHGVPMSLEGASGSISSRDALTFKVTDKGFDFGKDGTITGSSLTAKVVAKMEIAQDFQPGGGDSASRRGSRSQQNRPDGIQHRVFGNHDPTVSGEGADGVSIRMRSQVTPTNLP